MKLTQRFGVSLALLTDMYQITMTQAYWQKGMAEQEAVFHLYFRKNPFNGGYTLAAGLEDVTDLLQHFKFTEEDIAYLRRQKGNKRQALFKEDFLQYLSKLQF